MPYYHVTRLSPGGEKMGYARVQARDPGKALSYAKTHLLAPTTVPCEYMIEQEQMRKPKKRR
jgi:hypothetical protein